MPVLRAEPFEPTWRTVPTRLSADSPERSVRLSPAEGATRIEQAFRVLRGPSSRAVSATILPAHRDRTAALTEDRERFGAPAPVG